MSSDLSNSSTIPRRWLPGADRRQQSSAPDAIVERAPQRETARSVGRLYRALAVSDMVAVALALLLVVPATGKGAVTPLALLVLPVVVFLAKLHDLYERDALVIRRTTLDEAPELFRLGTLLTLFLWFADGDVLGTQLNGLQMFGVWISLPVLFVFGRVVARRLSRRSMAPQRCLFVGDAGGYARLAGKFEGTDAELVGRMSLRRAGGNGANHSAATCELRDLLEWTRAQRVIIDPEILPPEEMLDFVRAAKGVGVTVSLLPRVLDVVGSSVVFDDLGGMTVLSLRRFGLTRSSRIIKRAFDLCGGWLAFIAVAPLMAIIAVAIKLDSRGPVLFQQTRVGRDGRHFRIAKFRTMSVDAEARKRELRDRNEAAGGLFKIADDPRVTRVGRILRKTSLDELPQLLNVVRGDMSLVGPRPLVLDEDCQITGHDRARLHLTPGMTGPWQILGSARVPLAEMVKIDYLYVAGWSLWTDVKILLRTVPYMIARRGM